MVILIVLYPCRLSAQQNRILLCIMNYEFHEFHEFNNEYNEQRFEDLKDFV